MSNTCQVIDHVVNRAMCRLGAHRWVYCYGPIATRACPQCNEFEEFNDEVRVWIPMTGQ